MNKESELFKLLEIQSLNSLNEDESLDTLLNLIEYSFDLQTDVGTKKAIELSIDIEPNSKFPTKRTLYHYFLSIAWGDIRSKKRHTSDWEWDHKEYEQEIIHLRNALKYFSSEGLDQPLTRLCQIHTNLANSMDFCGRFVTAFENWNAALELDNNFGMALGAKGNSMIYHGLNSLYDNGHQSIYFGLGYQYLNRSITYPLEVYVLQDYTKKIKHLEVNYPWVVDYQPNLSETSESKLTDEVEYRAWCLENTLFLNPLNDLGKYAIANHDPFALPSMIVNQEKAGSYHSFFNQIKQEYVSARLFLYKGINDPNIHYADNGVMKYDLLDLSIQSIKLEQVKIAYRIAYSIFDKISYFLNYYLDLAIADQKVNFRTIWFDKKGELRDLFKRKPNPMFRALYWISKDLFHNNSNYKTALEPEATEFSKVRNHIEHKGFRVYDQDVFNDLTPSIFEDKLSYSISFEEFLKKTLKVVKTAREAIIYLSLGIRWEERERGGNDGSSPSINMRIK
ncbi:MAG: LA2681 family HEPN domain-containing protein [Ekhidna sp.]|uniref:LA2681 family HEPN domain-containing protein n=1 Tax=Ekhidna sp. TaxID=2608089 RepID=UPI0032ECE438